MTSLRQYEGEDNAFVKKRGSKSERLRPCRFVFHRPDELCSFSRQTAQIRSKPREEIVRKWIEEKIGRAIVLSIVRNDIALLNNKFIRANRAGSSVLIVSWAGENEITI